MSDSTAVLVGAAAAITGSLIAALLAQRETQRDRAQNALDWMTGHSQRRNVGIAAVEASWGPGWRRKRFRRLTTPVLCGTALYLLSASEQEDAPHELHNLDRIMNLLLDNPDARHFSGGYRAVLGAIDRSKERFGDRPDANRGTEKTGLFVSEQKLDRWRKQLLEQDPNLSRLDG